MPETKELKKTIREIQEVDQIMAQLYAKDATLQQAKIGYAYKRFVEKNYQPTITKLQEKLADARVDFALTDKNTGEVLVDKETARGFKYDKDGFKKIMESERKISNDWMAEEIIVQPFICKDIPKQLSEDDKEKLKGLII